MDRAELLKRPSPLFRLWTVEQPLDAKIAELRRRLLGERLYLSDEYRTEEFVNWLIGGWFNPSGPMSLVYEVGRDGGSFAGVMAFQGIIPGWKCGLMAKIWERRLWGPQLAKETKALLSLVEDTFALERVEIDTADLRAVRLGRMMGFDTEGVRVRAFRWDGEPFDIYELARIREVCDGEQESRDDEFAVSATATD